MSNIIYSSLPQLCQELCPLTNMNKLYTSVLFLNLKKFLIIIFFKDADEIHKNWSHFLLQLSNKVIVVG